VNSGTLDGATTRAVGKRPFGSGCVLMLNAVLTALSKHKSWRGVSISHVSSAKATGAGSAVSPFQKTTAKSWILTHSTLLAAS
jgi:hypothetical protein